MVSFGVRSPDRAVFDLAWNAFNPVLDKTASTASLNSKTSDASLWIGGSSPNTYTGNTELSYFQKVAGGSAGTYTYRAGFTLGKQWATGEGNLTVDDDVNVYIPAVGGSLSVIDSSSSINLASGIVNGAAANAVMYLSNTSALTVGGLSFNGVAQAAGTWAAPGSGTTNTNSTYFSGTGILDVVPLVTGIAWSASPADGTWQNAANWSGGTVPGWNSERHQHGHGPVQRRQLHHNHRPGPRPQRAEHHLRHGQRFGVHDWHHGRQRPVADQRRHGADHGHGCESPDRQRALDVGKRRVLRQRQLYLHQRRGRRRGDAQLRRLNPGRMPPPASPPC